MKRFLILTALVISIFAWLATDDIFEPGGIRSANSLYQTLTDSKSLEAIVSGYVYILNKHKKYFKDKHKSQYSDGDLYEIKDLVLTKIIDKVKPHSRIQIRVLDKHAEELSISWGVLGIGIVAQQGHASRHWYVKGINEKVYVYFNER